MTISLLHGSRAALAAGCLGLALGCAGGGPENGPEEAAGGEAATSSAAVVAGTPAGGMADWIGEIEAGLDTLPELATRAPAAAKNQALQLYVTRQEYIEIYYGTTGRAVKDPALAESVMTAEARFHEVLRAVNTPDGAIDGAALEGAVAALKAQYGAVLERARALGLETDRLVLATGGGSQ